MKQVYGVTVHQMSKEEDCPQEQKWLSGRAFSSHMTFNSCFCLTLFVTVKQTWRWSRHWQSLQSLEKIFRSWQSSMVSMNRKLTFQRICPNYREWFGLFFPTCPLLLARTCLETVPAKQNRHSAVCTTGINTTCKGKRPSLLGVAMQPDTALVAVLLDGHFFCVCLYMSRLPTLKPSTRVHVTAQWKRFSQNFMLSSGLTALSHWCSNADSLITFIFWSVALPRHHTDLRASCAHRTGDYFTAWSLTLKPFLSSLDATIRTEL